MSLLQRLVDQLEVRGIRVKPGAKPGELLLTGNTKEATPELMAAVKAFKPQLLERYGSPREPAPAPEPEPES